MPSDMIGISAISGYGPEWLSIRYSLKPEALFSDLLKFAKFKSVRFIVQYLHDFFDVYFKKLPWITGGLLGATLRA